MPRLPIYDPGSVNQPRFSAQDFGSAVATAVGQFGQQLMQTAQVIQRHEEERDVFEAQRLATQAKIDWAKRQEKRKQEAPEGAEGFAKQFEEDFDQWRAEYGTNLKTQRGRRALESSLDQIKLSGVADSIDFETRAFGQMQARQIGDSVSEFQNLVRANPGQLESSLEQSRALIDAAVGVDAQTKAKLYDASREHLFGSAIDGRVAALEANDDVTVAQVNALRAALVEDKEWAKNVNPAAYDAALTRLDRLKSSIENANDAVDRDAFHEGMRQLAATGANPQGYTEEDARALGRTTQEKNRLAKEFRSAALVGEEVTRSAVTPFQEDQARIVEMQKNLATTSDFDAQAAQLQAATEALSRKAKEFSADPAGYVLKQSPAIRAQYEKYAENPNPATFQNYVALSMADQKYIAPGVPPTIMPKAASEAIAQDMIGIATSETGVVNAARSLSQLQQNSGRYWPQVVRDLYNQKALDDVQMAAANTAGGSSPHIAEIVLRASGKSEAEWAKLTGEYTPTKARDEANAALKPLRASLAAQGNLNLYEAYSNALTRTLLYQRASGQSPDARKLASAMILDEYQFTGSMRVPQTQDVSTVRRASNRVMDGLDGVDIVPPPSLSGDLTVDDYKRSVKNFGVWTTSSDETGLVLRDDVGRPVLERRNGVVVPLKRTWEELRTIASEPVKPGMTPSYAAGKF